MRSIRLRLFFLLLAATGLVWLSAVVWIQHSTRLEVNHVLDRRLEESARMVASLIGRQGLPSESRDSDFALSPALETYEPLISRQLICQVWGLDGKLKSGSAGAPAEALAGMDASGYSQRIVETGGTEQLWRVYTHVDPDLGIRVMVGDAVSMRDGLVNGVIFGLLLPASLVLPVLALLIWLGVGHGLHPLSELARQLRGRSANDLHPLPEPKAAAELAPMIEALNGLFARVEGQRQREQNFTAFAAHQLKTPLAGIKTQAQIAQIAPDEATRSHALRQIRRGVERTDRLARQLLELASAEAHPLPTADSPKLAEIIAGVIRDLADLAETAGVELLAEAQGAVAGARVSPLLTSALRNLVENALQASSRGATVVIRAEPEGAELHIRVLDRGTGISEEDRPRITNRFYRGSRARPGSGSGLGLAIVEAAALQMGGRLTLSPRNGGGEEALLRLPLQLS